MTESASRSAGVGVRDMEPTLAEFAANCQVTRWERPLGQASLWGRVVSVKRANLVPVVGAAILAAFLSTFAHAQTAPPPRDPGAPVSSSTGSFSGDVTAAGIVSAAAFDGGSGVFTTLNTAGPNVLGGQTTAQGYLSGQDAGLNTGTFSGVLGVRGAATFGSAISAPVLDGGAVIATTVNTSGAAKIGGALTVQGSILDATAATVQAGNVQLAGGVFNLTAQALCDRRGSAAGGTTTCNTHAGCHTIAVGATARQISNNQAGTSGICEPHLGNADATCKNLACEMDAGVMVFRASDACTSALNFCWTVETGP